MTCSGIGVHDECLVVFEEIKMKRRHRYAFFRVSDNLKEIVLDRCGGPECSHDDFLDALPKEEPRFILYDFKYEETSNNDKLCFVNWCPDSAKMKTKMIHSSSKDAIKKKFNGINVEIQATDLDEVSCQSFLDKCIKK